MFLHACERSNPFSSLWIFYCVTWCAYFFVVTGNAYSATALFYIGLTLVGKIQGQMGMGLIVPLLLIGAKTWALYFWKFEDIGVVTSFIECDLSSNFFYVFILSRRISQPLVSFTRRLSETDSNSCIHMVLYSSDNAKRMLNPFNPIQIQIVLIQLSIQYSVNMTRKNKF